MTELRDLSFLARGHRSPEEKCRTVAMYLYGPYSLEQAADISMVSPRTVQEWVNEYQNGGLLERKSTNREKKFTEYHRDWIISKIREDPLLYADELVQQFKAAHLKDNLTISNSTVLRIFRAAGLTNQAVKRLAIQIRTSDIERFTREMHHCVEAGCNWSSYLFLDEVSTDSRDMMRKRGWFLRGR